VYGAVSAALQTRFCEPSPVPGVATALRAVLGSPASRHSVGSRAGASDRNRTGRPAFVADDTPNPSFFKELSVIIPAWQHRVQQKYQFSIAESDQTPHAVLPRQSPPSPPRRGTRGGCARIRYPRYLVATPPARVPFTELCRRVCLPSSPPCSGGLRPSSLLQPRSPTAGRF
jgi:hypothetical protein